MSGPVIQRPSGVNVGVLNPGDCVYVMGNAITEGSIRFQKDSETGGAIIEKLIGGVWQPGSFKTGPSIKLENTDTVVSAEDVVGNILFNAGESIRSDIAEILISAAEDWSDTSSPTRMEFFTTPNGSTNRIRRLTIDDTGYVGIGISATTEPDQMLHLYDGSIRLEGFSSDPTIFFTDKLNDDTWGFIFDRNNNDFHIVKKNAERLPGFIDDVMTFASNGDVGIGTLDPTHKLEVIGRAAILGDFSVDSPVFFVDVSSGYVGIGTNSPSHLLHLEASEPSILFENTDTVMAAGNVVGNLMFNAGENIRSDIAEILVAATEDWLPDSSSPTRMEFFTTPSGSITRVNRLTIDDTGYVGIGIVSPNRKLHVVGDVIVGLSGSDIVSGEALLVERAGVAKIIIRDSAAAEYTALTQQADNQAFTISRLGTGGTEISLQPDGDVILAQGSGGFVGINISSPSKLLDVNGDARIRGWLYLDDNLDVTGELTVFDDIIINGLVDGRDVAADGTKLDGIESAATADQTNAQIKTAYEANANSNEFSDAEQTKLAGISTGAEKATKEFFISAGAAILSSNASYPSPNDAYHLALADDVTFARCFFIFHLPSDFSSMVTGYPKVVFKQGAGGTGNYAIEFKGRSGGVGEQMANVISTTPEYTMSAPGVSDEIWEEDIWSLYYATGLAAGDSVGLQIQRDSDDALDTFNGDLDVVGIVIKYS